MEERYKLTIATSLGEKEVASFSTPEVAEQRASELNEHAEKNPRGYVRYVVRPIRGSRGGRGSNAT